MSFFDFNRRKIIKIKAISSAIAAVVAVGIVLPGIVNMAHSEEGIITSDDIVAYNSSKYEEETQISFGKNNKDEGDAFSGFDYVPEVTPNPDNDNSKERENLTAKMKEILKKQKIKAPTASVSGSKSGKNSSRVKVVTPAPQPTDNPEIADVPEETAIPKETENPEIAVTPLPSENPEPTPIPEDLIHNHNDCVERVEVYQTKFAKENNTAILAAVPNEEYIDKILSVEIALLHNDEEIERCDADDLGNILKVFEINMAERGYYEVELYITLKNEEATEPESTEENENENTVRQITEVLYVLGNESEGEVVQNPMTLQTEEVSEPVETPIPTEEPAIEEESVFTEDKKLEEISDLPSETPLTEEIPEEE